MIVTPWCRRCEVRLKPISISSCGCRRSQRAPDVGPEVPDESELFQEGRQRGTRGGETETARPAEGVPGSPEELLQRGKPRAERPVGGPGREGERAAGPETENGFPGGKDHEGIAGGRRLEAREDRIASTRHGERRLAVVRAREGAERIDRFLLGVLQRAVPLHERATPEVPAHLHAGERRRDVRPADGRRVLELELGPRDDAPTREEDPRPGLGPLVRAQRFAEDTGGVEERPPARRERRKRRGRSS